MVQVQQARFWFRGQNCFSAAHYWRAPPKLYPMLVSEHHIEQEIEYVKRTYNPCDLRVIAFKRLTGTHLVCLYMYV